MTEPLKAVFLSYASQDAAAAHRICAALRASGIEVWFDQSELRGGDAWDHQIRQRIHDCAMFIPVISAHTDERTEGYFRLEWKLAVDRSYLMAEDAAFIFPVVIDDTPEASARVPDTFRQVKWTRLPAGQAPPEFCKRVAALLAGTEKLARAARTAPMPARSSGRRALVGVAAVALIGLAGALAWRSRTPPPSAVPALQKMAAGAASVIPPHSIAVLPFEDASARKDQQYISDGLAEQLLNLLSKVPGMQVAARTSAFSFKGHAIDVRTIGRQLMVANVLEGSVSKVGNHLRVTAQLERADNGYQIWSETYDRQLGDVFRIQDEIAAAVVTALKVSLLGNSAPRSTSTQNTDAYFVLLQGRAKMATGELSDTKEAIGDFARAVKLDPNYASAYVELASAKLILAEYYPPNAHNYLQTVSAAWEEAKLLIERALALDPNDAQAYFARGEMRAYNDIAGAEQDYRRGLELNPSSASGYAGLATVLYNDTKRRDEAIAMLLRARQLDPLDPKYDILRALFYYWGRSDLKVADAMYSDILVHHPRNFEALYRLSDVRLTEGHIADAIMSGEQALKLEPSFDWTVRLLIWKYATIEDWTAARQVADQAVHPLPVHRIPFLMNSGDWHRAAELTYAAEADGTLKIASREYGILAIRMDARRTHDFGRAIAQTEKWCGVAWSDSGIPAIPPQDNYAAECVAAGDLLIASGDRARGERLLRASLADMDYVAHDLKRGDLWYQQSRATAQALLGNRKAALAALHEAVRGGYIDIWSWIPIDPAFEPLHSDPEFQAMVNEIKAKQASERQLLAQLRASGRVPDRSGGATHSASAMTTATR
jgi:TolB-like protein/cytochrome c-type biogenesis protein CcmH/NrfG